jgi:hypothetical protein
MTENTFPFAEAEETAPFEEEGERSRKAVLVAGGVAAALFLGAAGWFLLGGSSSDGSGAAFVPKAKTSRAAAVTTKKVVKTATKKLPVAYKAPLGRDPFRALYVLPVAAPAAAATTTTPTTTTTTTGTGTTTPTSTTTSGTPGTTRYALKLVSISKPSPELRFTTWLVEGKRTVVIPAQRFGKHGELVVLAFVQNASGVVDKAIIQVGDDSPMDVLVGETVSVL